MVWWIAGRAPMPSSLAFPPMMNRAQSRVFFFEGKKGTREPGCHGPWVRGWREKRERGFGRWSAFKQTQRSLGHDCLRDWHEAAQKQTYSMQVIGDDQIIGSSLVHEDKTRQGECENAKMRKDERMRYQSEFKTSCKH